MCEATCGLTLTIENGRVTGARGDREDVFSQGFICPKGASFAELDNDPDRLTRPLVRRDGQLTEATWDEAYAVIAERLGGVVRDHVGTSVGVYLGNPCRDDLEEAVARIPTPKLLLNGVCRPDGELDRWRETCITTFLVGGPRAAAAQTEPVEVSGD